MSKVKKLLKLFWIFFKIGSFTFGGGMAMLPLIQREVVDNQKWISEDEILDIFAIAQSTPGVLALNSSIFIGNKVMGFWGAVAAALAVTIPAFVSIILLLLVLTNLKNNVYVSKVFNGVKAASAALILLSAEKLGRGALKAKSDYIIGIVSFLIIIVLNINAAYAVIFGGVSGYLIYIFNRRKNNA